MALLYPAMQQNIEHSLMALLYPAMQQNIEHSLMALLPCNRTLNIV